MLVRTYVRTYAPGYTVLHLMLVHICTYVCMYDVEIRAEPCEAEEQQAAEREDKDGSRIGCLENVSWCPVIDIALTECTQ